MPSILGESKSFTEVSFVKMYEQRLKAFLGVLMRAWIDGGMCLVENTYRGPEIRPGQGEDAS